MSLFLKQSTAVVVSYGVFVDKTDGVTEETGLVSALDHATTGIKLSKNGGALTIRHATVTATTYDAYGMYRVTLDTTDTNTVGTLRMAFNEAATCLPVWQDFMVLPANVYDSLVGGTDALDVSAIQFAGQTITASGGVTIPAATLASTTNITAAAGCAVSSIGANVITAASIQADAITDAKVASDVTIASVTGAVGSVTGAVGSVTGAVGSVTGNVGGNVVGSVGSVVGHTAQTGDSFARLGAPAGASVSADIAAVKAETAATAIENAVWNADPSNHDFAALGIFMGNGPSTSIYAEVADAYARLGAPAGASVSADIAAIKAETATIQAKTTNLPAAPASTTNITAASGVTLAATTGLGNQTANITGNLSGSVGSVTGAVGSVTGAVGSVTGAVGSVTGAVGSVTGNVGGNVTGSVGSVATGGIAAASFAAGAINAAAIAADAITDAKVASDVTIASVTGAVGSVTGAVGSVTGNVGGNVTGSVGSVAANGITATSIATDAINAAAVKADAVTKIQAGLATPTNITAGTLTTVTNLTNLPAAAALEATLTAMKGATFSGATDSLEAIRDRGDAAWATATGFSTLDAAGVRTAVGLASADLDAQLAALPTAAEIADANWDEAMSGHLAAGTTGKALSDAGAAGTPLDAAGVRAAVGLASANLDTQLGAIDDLMDTEVAAIKTVVDGIDTKMGMPNITLADDIGAPVVSLGADVQAVKVVVDTIAGYLDTEIAAIKAKTDNLPASPSSLDAAGVRTAIGMASANLDTQLGNTYNRIGAPVFGNISGDIAANYAILTNIEDSVGVGVSADVAAIKAKTDNLPADPASSTNVTAVYSRVGAPAGASVSADIAAVKAETATINTATGAAAIRAAVGLASANLDTQLAAIDDLLDTEIGAIKAKTDLIPASPASTTNITAAAGIALTSGERNTLADAIFDRADGAVSGKTLREALSVILGVLSGKVSGAGTATITFRHINDTKDVIVATVDAAGNRTAVTVTP